MSEEERKVVDAMTRPAAHPWWFFTPPKPKRELTEEDKALHRAIAQQRR